MGICCFSGGALVDKQAHVEVDKQVYTVDALETHPKIPWRTMDTDRHFIFISPATWISENQEILLMAEILHQLIGSLSHYL